MVVVQLTGSVPVTVMGKLPVTVGVPEIVAVPVPPLHVSPFGSDPDCVRVIVPVPPVPVMVWEYGNHCVADARAAGVILIGGQMRNPMSIVFSVFPPPTVVPGSPLAVSVTM